MAQPRADVVGASEDAVQPRKSVGGSDAKGSEDRRRIPKVLRGQHTPSSEITLDMIISVFLAPSELATPDGEDEVEMHSLTSNGSFAGASHDGLMDYVANVYKSHPIWIWTFTFIFIQLGCFFAIGDSFFGWATGGVVESLRLSTGVEMTWHMICGSVMWALGFVQVFCSSLRRGSLAWIHRLSGIALLLLWFLVVGPTAAWLSLYVGVGQGGRQLSMFAFAAIGMDSSLFATYYFAKAWLIARRRARGSDSLELHGRVMRTGIMFTMLILFQRPVQFVLIVVRKLLLLQAWVLPTSWATLRWALEGLAYGVFDHHFLLSFTTVFPVQGCLFFWLDGPRCSLGYLILDLKGDEDVEVFGSRYPSTIEKWFWRSRYLIYLTLRLIVTGGFSEDPVHQVRAL